LHFAHADPRYAQIAMQPPRFSATHSPCQRMSRSDTKRHLTGCPTQDPDHSDMAVLRAVLVALSDKGVKRGGWTGPSTVSRRRSPKRSHTRTYSSSHYCDTYRLPFHGVGEAPGDVGKTCLEKHPVQIQASAESQDYQAACCIFSEPADLISTAVIYCDGSLGDFPRFHKLLDRHCRSMGDTQPRVRGVTVCTVAQTVRKLFPQHQAAT
jgi:hypothetical protein